MARSELRNTEQIALAPNPPTRYVARAEIRKSLLECRPMPRMARITGWFAVAGIATLFVLLCLAGCNNKTWWQDQFDAERTSVSNQLAAAELQRLRLAQLGRPMNAAELAQFQRLNWLIESYKRQLRQIDFEEAAYRRDHPDN